MNTTKAQAYAAQSATSPLVSITIPRRAPTDRDVQIEILFCGICRSDVHQVRNEASRSLAGATPQPNRSLRFST